MQTTHRARRSAGIAVAALLVALAAPAPVFSVQDPGTSGGVGPSHTDMHCPLNRIGTELVRCDALTGAGTNAPSWIPER